MSIEFYLTEFSVFNTVRTFLFLYTEKIHRTCVLRELFTNDYLVSTVGRESLRFVTKDKRSIDLQRLSPGPLLPARAGVDEETGHTHKPVDYG